MLWHVMWVRRGGRGAPGERGVAAERVGAERVARGSRGPVLRALHPRGVGGVGEQWRHKQADLVQRALEELHAGDGEHKHGAHGERAHAGQLDRRARQRGYHHAHACGSGRED